MSHLPVYRRRPLMFCQQLLAVVSTYTSRRTLLLMLPAFLFMLFPAFQIGEFLEVRKTQPTKQPTIQPRVVLSDEWMVDGAGFQPFERASARLPENARMLALQGHAVTDDAVLELLSGHSDSLLMIDLAGTATGSSALKRIARLPSLVGLRLDWVPVTATDLRTLAAESKLKSLTLRGVSLDQERLSSLAEMTGLPALILEDLQVDSTLDLSVLRRMKSLTALHFRNVALDNQSLQSLSEMKQLQHLSLRDTALSQEAVNRLRSQLPDTQIKHSQKSMREAVSPKPQTIRGGSPLLMLFCPLFMIVPMLAMHVRAQVADTRSRIIPGFAAPHLTVATAILLVLCVVLSLVATLGSDGSFFGMLSLVTAAAVLLFGTGYFQSAVLSFGVIGGMLWLGFGAPDSVVQWIVQNFLRETRSNPFIVLLTGSLVAFVCLLRRMFRIHEGMCEYGVTADVESFWNQRSTSARRQQQRVQAWAISRLKVAVFLCDHVAGWLMRHLPRQPVLRRLIQFQIAHGMAIVMVPIMLIVMFLMMQVFSGMGRGPIGGPAAVMGLVIMLPIMAQSMVLGAWMQHYNWFASELMFPLDRRMFVKSFLLGILLDGVIVLVIAEILIATLMARQIDSGGVPMNDLWLAAAVLCGANIMSGSAMLSLVLSYRSFWWLQAGLIGQAALFGATTAIVMETLENGFAALSVMLPVAFAGCSLMGMWLMLAWRRWNNLEFG